MAGIRYSVLRHRCNQRLVPRHHMDTGGDRHRRIAHMPEERRVAQALPQAARHRVARRNRRSRRDLCVFRCAPAVRGLAGWPVIIAIGVGVFLFAFMIAAAVMTHGWLRVLSIVIYRSRCSPPRCVRTKSMVNTRRWAVIRLLALPAHLNAGSFAQHDLGT